MIKLLSGSNTNPNINPHRLSYNLNANNCSESTITKKYNPEHRWKEKEENIYQSFRTVSTPTQGETNTLLKNGNTSSWIA